MAKKHHTRKKSALRSTFYRVYFVLVALCVVLLGFGLNYLWGMMEDFEASRPIYAAQESIKLFENADYAAIYALDSSAAQLGDEDMQDYIDYMTAYASGKTVSFKEAFSASNTLQNYTVMLDNEKFATITLSATGEKTKHGNDVWALSGIATNVLRPVEYTITAPADSIVSVNGRVLTAEDAVETNIPTKSDGLLPEGLASPTMTKYSVKLALGQPEITSTDRFGAQQQITDEGNNAYSFPLAYDLELSRFDDSIIKVAKRMANFTSEDISQSQMSGYTYKDSPAQTYVNSFNNQWCPAHTGYDFENMTVSKYYAYSDEVFSCEVDFQYVIHYHREEDNVYDTTYTMYFKEYKGEYRLYNFTMN